MQVLCFKKTISSLLLLLTIFTATTANARVPEWVQALGQHRTLESVQPERQSEITCLALAIYYEARGESERGQRAVAQVVVNRSKSGRFPSTICGVLFQSRQFSFINGSPLIPRNSSWDRAIAIAMDMIDAPRTNWLFFCNCGRSGVRIGNHIFY